jgi:predicted AlkP superfamily phosphohydrolase/phosphomutase
MRRSLAGRVLVIGLDMGDGSLVERWSAEGVLPTFRSILSEGKWGALETTAEALHTSTWPTLYTGTLPGTHGVYYPYQPKPGRQQATHIGAEQYGAPPMWETLDRAGKRCIILDAPETFPVSGFTGVQIFEWGTWAWYWKRMTTPPVVERDLTREFGPYPLKLEAKRLGLGVPDPASLYRGLCAGAAQKAAITRALMRKYPWDLFLVVFAETHSAGHYFWPPHVAARDGASGHQSTQLRDVYAAVDAAIGQILEECGDDVTAFVVSGDGVGPNHCAWHLLPEILARLGFAGVPLARGSEAGGSGKSPFDYLRRALSPRLRSELQSRLPWQFRHWLGARLAEANTDWSRTKAFALPADLEGCIRINLRGREPRGIVEPGSHYDDVCDELTERLQELVNPATGREAVGRVCRIDRLFPGERCSHLPDLTVVWNDEAEIREVHSNRLGLVSEGPNDPRSGTHRPESLLAVRGPRCRPGRLGRGHIADLAPTVLAQLGITPPAETDGRPLEIFE